MIFSLLDEKKYDIIGLQETHWVDEFIENYKHLWKGRIIYNNSDVATKGVAFLIRNDLKDNIKFEQGFNGRFLHIKYKENDEMIDIINIYAPNIVKERTRIFHDISERIPHSENLIILGDFNNTLGAIDRCGKTRHVYDQSYQALFHLMNEHNVVDLWRSRNTREKVFSRKLIVGNTLVQSRIDYILISHVMKSYVRNIFYVETTLSDHSMVVMYFNNNACERGPGLWIHNNMLLNDDTYRTKIIEIIEKEKSCMLYENSILVWWDNLKYKLKKFSQSFSKTRAKERNKEYYNLQNKMQRIAQNMANGLQVDIEKYEAIKQELAEFENEKCKGAMLRSKAQWAQESDKCTKYFLNLEKRRQESNSVKELLNENQEIKSDIDSILDIEYKFFSELYSSVQIDSESKTQFLSYVNRKINDSDKELCDSNIREDEIENAIKEMANNKSPGSDGLTVEFYKAFLPQLRNILFKLYVEVEKKETMSNSMKMGVITLLYKKKGDKKLLKNWRPISLLNVDYKIIARVMSNRLKQVLPNIICETQTCCIIGRDIADTLVSIRDVIYMVEMDNLEGYIIKIDQEKAFDRVSHDYLFDVLNVFGFGTQFRKWVQIFYTNIYSSIKCNGHLTKYFPIHNSVRQGCPISALLYVLTAEPLNYIMKHNSLIRGIPIPMSNEKGMIFQHADDTTMTVCDKNSIFEIFKVFDLYGKASGAKINIQKSEIMCIGTGKIFEHERTSLRLSETSVMKILGIYFSKNKVECENLNWRDKVKNIRQTLNLWRMRCLTIQGRAILINTMFMSKLWYSLAVISIPQWARNCIQKECSNFLWNFGSHLVSYKTIIGEKYDGGLKICDIYLKMLSFRLKFLGKYFCADKEYIWKHIFRYFISKIQNLAAGMEIFLLQFKKVELQVLPQFYNEIFCAWYAIKEYIISVEKETDVFNYCLFFNPKVQRGNKLLNWKDFISAGITHVRDITYEVIPGFLPVSCITEILQETNTDVNKTHVEKNYTELMLSIPEEWKNHVDKNEYKRSCFKPDFLILYRDQRIVFHSGTVKVFYNLLVQKMFQEPVSNTYWKNKFNLRDQGNIVKRWETMWNSYKTPDIIELDFKIFHNVIFTYEKLFKIGKTDTNKCPICILECEDILHLFIRCNELNNFKDNFVIFHLESLLKDCEDSVYNRLNFEEIFMTGLHHETKNVNAFFINYFMSICRLCIYRRRQIFLQSQKKLDVEKLSRYTLRHYISYHHYQLTVVQKKTNLFKKLFLSRNSLVKETEGILLFLF